MKKVLRGISFTILFLVVLASTFTVSARKNEITFIENSGISVVDDMYFTGMPENTQVSEILNRLSDKEDIFAKDLSGVNCDETAVIGTGYSLSVVQFSVTNKKLEAVVLGDTSGDGKVSSADYLKIKNTFKGLSKLEGSYFMAADTNYDGRISTTDYARVKKHIKNQFNLHVALPEVSSPGATEPPAANFSIMSNSVEYANQVKNQVDTYFADKDRTAIVYENATMTLVHGLIGSGVKQVQEFKNKDGGVYFTDTFVPFMQNGNEISYLKDGADTNSQEGTPSLRFGYYYYQNEIRNVNFPSVKIVRVSEIYNVLPDSLRFNQRLIIDKSATISSDYIYGNELKIAVDTVKALEIKDNNGTYSSINNYDVNSVEYVAFDIKEAGVVGLIFAKDSLFEKVTVTLEGDYYVIRSTMNISSFVEGKIYDVAVQLYNDTTHSFEGVREAAYKERNPVTVSASNNYLIVPQNTPYYDSTTGLYRVIAGYVGGHQHAYETRTATVNLTASNDDHERPLYIHVNSSGQAAMASGIVRDGNGNVTAIPTEFCRNFTGDDPAYESDIGYGDMIYPVYLEENQSITTIPTIFMNDWGKTSYIQFSSIQYYFMYTHSSKDASETTCLKPTGGGIGGSIVADFRGVSGDKWTGSNPQYNHAGNFYFVNEYNVFWNSMYRGMDIESAGPNYVDVDMDYVAESGNYKYTLTHKEFAYDDETRNCYTIDITFLKDVTYTDATKNFQIFHYYTSMGDYSRMAWLDENKEEKVKVPRATLVSLGTGSTFFTFYKNASNDTENVGFIIKDYSVTMGGNSVELPIAMNVLGKSRAYLVFDQKTLSFKAGDKVTFDVILLPYGNSQQDHYDNVLKVYNDSVVNPITVTTTVGKVVEDAFIPKVYAENNRAEFTLKGGADNIAVRIDGFTSEKVPVIEEYVDGNWIPFVYYTDLGYDGYNIYYNEDNTYGFTYTVPMGTNGSPRQFRISQ